MSIQHIWGDVERVSLQSLRWKKTGHLTSFKTKDIVTVDQGRKAWTLVQVLANFTCNRNSVE